MINSFSELESEAISTFVMFTLVVLSAYAEVKLEAKFAVKNAKEIRATIFLNDFIINHFLFNSIIYEIIMKTVKICKGM